ncbi:MAG: ABC transporter permease [Thermoleophilia bacterium]|nr:ABC transporter permease [Thermoleophilia bacterium]
MGRYIIRRLLWTVVVVLTVTVLAFVIFFVMPSGDPATRFAGKQPTPELVAEVKASMGLDKSVPEQYWLFVKRLAVGDEYGYPGLGKSFQTKQAVLPELKERAKVTGTLIIGGAILWLAIGIPVGVISALKRGTIWDRLSMGTALFFVSAPVFWLGLLSLWFFWKTLGLPLESGYTPITDGPTSWFLHMVLPWSVLALLFAAIYARIVRGNMIDAMNEDYVRTARAKGLRERQVVVKHELRASIAPVITLLAIDLGVLVGGTIVTESVFNLPGLGRWLLVAAETNDLPVTLAVTVLVATAVSVLSLVADILYAVLDPRVRYR